ncbi:hypothetical protein C8R43DRAFT_1038671 [Mycena crocata]|nr:hypothetical protein C8R43DRAFT_1038671 [Mycena crocata]
MGDTGSSWKPAAHEAAYSGAVLPSGPSVHGIASLFDVAGNAFQTARTAAAECMAQLFAVHEALKTECNGLRSDVDALAKSLEEERRGRRLEQEACSVERATFKEAEQAFREEKVSILREKDSLATRLEVALRDLKAASDRANELMCVKPENTHQGVIISEPPIIEVKMEESPHSHRDVIKSEPSIVKVKMEELVHPLRDAEASRKRPRPEEDTKVDMEESREKIRKLASRGDTSQAPIRRQVEVVITRRARQQPPGSAEAVCAPDSSSSNAAISRQVPASRPVSDFATLAPRQSPTPPRILRPLPRGGNPPLLETPVFKQCVWSTDFFNKTMNLDVLLADKSLIEYFPFIMRLHRLNEAGIYTSYNATAPTTYGWECVLRFLVLDMLLRAKGYKAAPGLTPDGSTIPRAAQTFTEKLYKWQQYLADAVALKNPEAGPGQNTASINRQPRGAPAKLVLSRGHRNLLTTTLGIMSIIEESALPSSDTPAGSVLLSSVACGIDYDFQLRMPILIFSPFSNFHKFPAAARDNLPPTLAATTLNRHLAIFLFISPLGALLDQDLVAPVVSMQQLFETTRALGTVRPDRIHLAEDYVRHVVCTLIAHPELDVAGAFAATQGAPAYVPPPYNESFFCTEAQFLHPKTTRS